MKDIEYNEWVPAGALIKSLPVIICLIVVFVTFAIFLFRGVFAQDILGIAFIWAILAIILFIFWNYRGLRIQITKDRLYVDYGIFNKKSFLLKEIIACKKTKSLGKYAGLGVKYGPDGSVAYITSFASAVEVTPKVGKVFVFSSMNPDKVRKTIIKGIIH